MLRLKLALLAALALMVPACGGDTSVAAPLLSENFNGAFPGTNWTVPATTGASAPTVAISGSVLKFTPTGVSSGATTTTVSSFNNPGVTFQLQMSALTTGGAAGEKGLGTIEILNGSNTVVASLTWDPEPVTPTITYTFQGTPAGPFTAPVSDGTLNLFRFSVNSMGTASWSFNNGNVATQASFPAGALKLRIGASSGTGTMWPEFAFDTITVTSP